MKDKTSVPAIVDMLLSEGHTMNVVDKIMDYESGQMSEEEMIEFFQELVDTGIISSLQGSYQRTAMGLYQAGLIHKPGEGPTAEPTQPPEIPPPEPGIVPGDEFESVQKSVDRLLTEVAVIVKEVPKTETTWTCPHCREIIQEKSLYCDGKQYFHRVCKGPIELPPPTEEQKAWMKKDFGLES